MVSAEWTAVNLDSVNIVPLGLPTSNGRPKFGRVVAET
jgi:hypothetical protein